MRAIFQVIANAKDITDLLNRSVKPRLQTIPGVTGAMGIALLSAPLLANVLCRGIY